MSARMRQGRGEAWTLMDFFPSQPSKEEVEAQREYDAVRQRIRYAKTPEAKATLRHLEEAAKTRLYEAHERIRALVSQRESPAPHTVSHRVTHIAPPRPVPPRPVQDEDEDEAVAPEKLIALRELPASATLTEKVTVFAPLPSDERPARSKSRSPRP